MLDMTVTVGDLLIIAAFIFQAGMSWAVLLRCSKDIRDLRGWKHQEVIPKLTDLKVRVGLLESRVE